MQGAFDKLAQLRPALARSPEAVQHEDEFLRARDLVPVHRQTAAARQRMARSEIEELTREKRWQAILDLFYPVEEKLPELVAQAMDLPVRDKLAFALGQLGRFDDAITQLTQCVQRDADNYHTHNALAYTAYNSLFAAANREIFLAGAARQARIELARRHFGEALRLRPDSVTNCYRLGMLWHKIEHKPTQAMPLFARAVENWERLTTEQRQLRHQEHKNYIKALYQKAGLLLDVGDCRKAAETLKRCLTEDEQSDHVSRLHKYFALGKVEYHAGRFQEAKNALLFAEKCRDRAPIDYVYELLARVYLALDAPDKALAAIERVPETQRRPYFRWTEADVLCALNRYTQARSVLEDCIQRDRRSRHKGLLRLCRIAYLLGDYAGTAVHAAEADRFFREQWHNPCAEALFWQALGAFKSGKIGSARQLAEELRTFQPGYPKLERLLALLDAPGGAHADAT